MGFFSNELANVVEWKENNPNVLFWKWTNGEIKKGSKLILRPGQKAIFMYNGRVEGIFEEGGSFDIESQIIPFLSTLKGFKFGFNSGLRAEVLFINCKEVLSKWGTKNPISIPAPGLPGGMPIRAFGTFSCAITDYMAVIEKLAGIKQLYTVEDVRERLISVLDQSFMQAVATEGKDIFNLQMYAGNISKKIKEEMDYEMHKIGISVTDFRVESFSYPEQVKQMQEKAAAQAMIGDTNKYTQLQMADSMANGNGGRPSAGANFATDMAQMQMGMMMANQMVNNMNNQMNTQMNNQNQATPAQVNMPAGGAKFCPNCGTPTNGGKFCANCGQQL